MFPSKLFLIIKHILPLGKCSIHHAQSLVGTCVSLEVFYPDKRGIHRNEKTYHGEF